MAPGQRNDAPGSLPAGFVTVRDTLDGKVRPFSLINVAGLVKDVMPPMPTRGSDWKSTVTIYDRSSDENADGLVINIFGPQADIPTPGVGDCFLVFKAKVQDRGGISLLSNRESALHVYTAAQIPAPPETAARALNPPCGGSRRRLPASQEHAYVSYLYHATSKVALPDPADFHVQMERSRNTRDKFSLLSDVRDHRFHDLIVQVVKDPYYEMDKVCMWVTDYTENTAFYHYTWKGEDNADGQDGDPYGYTILKDQNSGWPGPFGKRSMQITCWGSHGELVRSELQQGSYVRLRNVHIKWGHNGNNLEGVLHEDRNTSYGKLLVEILRISDKETIDERLRNVIMRKRAYEKAKKEQQKSHAAAQGGQTAGTKRKNGSEEPTEQRQTTKERRKQKRAAKQAEYEQKEQAREAKSKTEARRGLNANVKCDHQDQPVTPISSIAEKIPWKTTIDGLEKILHLPFVCGKYRTNARVVDFRPRKLEDFACWRKSTEFDMLDDYSGDSDSSHSEDENETAAAFYRGVKTWEWRFALQIEEFDPVSSKGGPPHKIWVVVDNIEAQLLINLDACDLRADPETLDQLRERLFNLWGNLEERKREEWQRGRQHQRPAPVNGLKPPLDSSPPPGDKVQEEKRAESPGGNISNIPFSCCIRQYGIKLAEPDEKKADAGDGYRWERVFGLFGTKISF